MTIRGRTGRGWDAATPRPPRRSRKRPVEPENDPDLWGPDPEAAEVAPERRQPREEKKPEPPKDERERAREICLNQLGVRPRTRSELATAMTKRGISAEIVEEVLDRYDEVGIIDDAAFARAWVESRHYGKGLARRALGQELRRRGVDQEVIKGALAELEVETEEVTARELVERKLRTMRGDPEAMFRKLVAMLARKGYPPGIAFRAVKDVLAQVSDQAEEFTEGRKVWEMGWEAKQEWAEGLALEAMDSEGERPDRV
ncbi:MAG: regulatory protein RecX [Hamadaea sp.]|uniref:regulatory protein RecX n=1 Tax=Hamadaea sp. TaxID=2024425 RepID=UPI0017AEAA31|nr:RecX family transcriptional regulator [Hamadaea sp.]NUR72641.1 regulatory protein RecX [Hamadaea sp.]NUT19736.1 regulatory protein RecX [Hamadaea sp.]